MKRGDGMTPETSGSQGRRRAAPGESVAAWLYLAPAGVVLLVFWFLPVFGAIGISFTNWEGADTLDIVGWVGGFQYARTLRDEAFWGALGNTVNYALYSVPLTLGAALGLALLLHGQMRGLSIFRTMFFLPYASTWVAVSVLWRFFFDPELGPLNYVMTEWLGMEPLRWLGEPRGVIEMFMTGVVGLEAWPDPPVLGPLLAGPSLAMVCVILTSVWHDIGFFLVIFLAGLGNIDASYYEAARLDGAGPWQRFRTITLPLLTPTTFFCLVVAMIGAFRVFVPILVMTPGGGPGKTTSTIVFYMYEKGFMQWKLGQGSAIALLLFAIIFVLTMLQNRLLGRRVQYEQ